MAPSLDSRGRRRGRLDVPRRRIQIHGPAQPAPRDPPCGPASLVHSSRRVRIVAPDGSIHARALGDGRAVVSRLGLQQHGLLLEKASSASGDGMRGCPGKRFAHFEFGQCGVWRRCLAWRPCRTRRDVHLSRTPKWPAQSHFLLRQNRPRCHGATRSSSRHPHPLRTRRIL